MRYRGAIEYDKMVLNILSFYNEVTAICEDERYESELQQTIGSYLKKCDYLIEQYEKIGSIAMTRYQKEQNQFMIFNPGIGEVY